MKIIAPGRLFIVSAPSGAGKSTVVQEVIRQLGPELNLARVITYTTKKPRSGELNGKDYHFVSVAEFEQKRAAGFFIEHSTAYGHYYGSPRYILDELKQGNSYISVIDRAGAQQVKAQADPVLIWIYTKNYEQLPSQLRGRNTENEAEIERRLALAKQELEDERINTFYQHHVCNDSIENAVTQVAAIIRKELTHSMISEGTILFGYEKD